MIDFFLDFFLNWFFVRKYFNSVIKPREEKSKVPVVKSRKSRNISPQLISAFSKKRPRALSIGISFPLTCTTLRGNTYGVLGTWSVFQFRFFARKWTTCRLSTIWGASESKFFLITGTRYARFDNIIASIKSVHIHRTALDLSEIQKWVLKENRARSSIVCFGNC